MATGDKKPVVMEFDRGVASGIATLDNTGILAEAQRPKAEQIVDKDGNSIPVLLSEKDPTQWGLGADCVIITDWNLAISNGWYRTISADPNNNSPDGMAWYGHVTAYGNYLLVQEVWHINSTEVANHCIRWLINGAWSPWEWVNPPMLLGVEYRTTERYLGKTVYVMAVDFGELPNATEKRANVGGSECRPVSATGYCPNTFEAFGLGYTAGLNLTLRTAHNAIIIVTTTDVSDWTATIAVKYWKTTD